MPKDKWGKFGLTMIIAALGGVAGIYLEIPAGAMIGSMIAVAVFNIFSDSAHVPPNMRKTTQILTGAFLGSRIAYNDILELSKIIVPGIIMVVGLVILSLLFGLAMHKFTGLDLPTSFLASAPGGIADMSLVAEEMGADAPKVALLQLLRVVSVIGLFPLVMRLFCEYFTK